MKVRKTLKYRLYRNRRNKYLMNRIDVAGSIWNHTIALQRRYYRLTRKYIAQSRMQRHLLKLRRSQRFGFWQKVGSQAVQQIAERHHQAYQQFFDNKAGRSQVKVGRPTFFSLYLTLDTTGHYSRPDISQLHVNWRKQSNVIDD